MGTYTGYSALVAALAVPDEGGLVVALDCNANYMDWAHRCVCVWGGGGCEELRWAQQQLGPATIAISAAWAGGCWPLMCLLGHGMLL